MIADGRLPGRRERRGEMALAAARPAGPAPTMSTSKSRRSAIGADLHAVSAWRLAGEAVGLAVDGRTAFEADAYAAEGAAGGADDGTAEGGAAGQGQRRGDGHAGRDFKGSAVNLDAKRGSHAFSNSRRGASVNVCPSTRGRQGRGDGQVLDAVEDGAHGAERSGVGAFEALLLLR